MTLTAWAKLSPSSNPPPSRMQGGTSPRTRFYLNPFNLVGQSPRWSACCPRGARQSPVWGMNEPNGLSTPLWCGQVHCPYGHEPMASWSGFRGVWGVDIHQKQTYGASVTSRKAAHWDRRSRHGGRPSGKSLKKQMWSLLDVIGYNWIPFGFFEPSMTVAPLGNHGEI